MEIIAFFGFVLGMVWLLMPPEKKPTKRYEVCVVFSPDDPEEIEKRVEKYQNDGWEICGDIKIGHNSHTAYVQIPFRRIQK